MFALSEGKFKWSHAAIIRHSVQSLGLGVISTTVAGNRYSLSLQEKSYPLKKN
jgi:hypothetical protein